MSANTPDSKTAIVRIDLNVRHGDGTYVGFEDVLAGNVTEGMEVQVTEPESGIVGHGSVTSIDNQAQIIFLAIDWPGLHNGRGEA